MNALPAGPGAYLLTLRLGRASAVWIAGRAIDLGPGWYAYAGSARGPGGIAARAGRHLRGAAAAHWHIDQAIRAADAIAALAYPDDGECALAGRLRRHPRVHVPVPGFGASDCRTCTAHLVALPLPADAAPAEAETLVRALAGRPAAVLWKAAAIEETGSG